MARPPTRSVPATISAMRNASMESCSFLEHYRYFALPASPQESDGNFFARAVASHDALQVSRFRDRFILSRNNHIQALEFSMFSRAIAANLEHFHAKLLPKIEAL